MEKRIKVSLESQVKLQGDPQKWQRLRKSQGHFFGFFGFLACPTHSTDQID